MIDDDSFDEIKQIFFEEADEGLDVMESGLLDLDKDHVDTEIINNVFRAAHSIKGGSATFGFNSIAEFTHLMETLLDRLRDGSMQISEDRLQILLKSVDCLREMINSIKGGKTIQSEQIRETTLRLEQILDPDTGTMQEMPTVASEVVVEDTNIPEHEGITTVDGDSEKAGWKILFKPESNILRMGNDPGRIFRELATYGKLSVEADLSEIPEFKALAPEDCFTSWLLQLESYASIEQVEEAFDWVASDSYITIEPMVNPDAVKESNSTASADESNKEDKHADNQAKDSTASVSETSKAEATKAQPVEKPRAAAKASAAKSPTKSPAKDGGSIRVSIDKIDSLLNLVGELVITQSMLNRFGSSADADTPNAEGKDLREGLSQLENNARELQEVAMNMRMLPIKTTFSRFPRLVHDLSHQLGKKIEMKIIGEHTEVDKTVLEKIGDPLVHLVRNSLDHGIEMPEERLAAGKPETGVITLKASQQAGNIILEISDDGKGLDAEKLLAKARERGLVGAEEKPSTEKIHNLIFHPGFSTAQVVSDVSGRGVGMDVVKRNIHDLGGRVDVQSEPGVGSTITIRLPLTLAILDGQLVIVNAETYVIPLLSILETVVVEPSKLNLVAGSSSVYRLRDEYIQIINLGDVFSDKQGFYGDSANHIANKLLVVVESAGKLVGLVVDDLQDQQQIVIKNLESNYKQVDGMSGATILGDGTVSLIIDIPGLIESCFEKKDNALLDNVAA